MLKAKHGTTHTRLTTTAWPRCGCVHPAWCPPHHVPQGAWWWWPAMGERAQASRAVLRKTPPGVQPQAGVPCEKNDPFPPPCAQMLKDSV